MTSKEALERISNIDLQEYPSEEEMYAFKECRVSPIPLGLCFTEEFETISKDLEILEIIKKWSFIQESYKEGYGPYTKFQCIIHTIGMEEDFEKVKEWLEN